MLIRRRPRQLNIPQQPPQLPHIHQQLLKPPTVPLTHRQTRHHLTIPLTVRQRAQPHLSHDGAVTNCSANQYGTSFDGPTHTTGMKPSRTCCLTQRGDRPTNRANSGIV